jgi:AcrR family transcriptional regulator
MSDLKSTGKRAKEGRLPVQERSAARMSKVLEAAVRMLDEVGPERTSIPALSAVTGVPRAAIYPFFPDKYALFSHLARMYMEGLSKALATSKAARARSWRAWVDAAIEATAQYYNAHPAASILLFRGAFGDTDSAAHAAKNLAIGRLFRAKAASLSALRTLPSEPDVATISVEIAFACMKHGYAQEGRISPAICREASRAVVAYLSVWDERRQ